MSSTNGFANNGHVLQDREGLGGAVDAKCFGVCGRLSLQQLTAANASSMAGVRDAFGTPIYNRGARCV